MQPKFLRPTKPEIERSCYWSWMDQSTLRGDLQKVSLQTFCLRYWVIKSLSWMSSRQRILSNSRQEFLVYGFLHNGGKFFGANSSPEVCWRIILFSFLNSPWCVKNSINFFLSGKFYLMGENLVKIYPKKSSSPPSTTSSSLDELSFISLSYIILIRFYTNSDFDPVLSRYWYTLVSENIWLSILYRTLIFWVFFS